MFKKKRKISTEMMSWLDIFSKMNHILARKFIIGVVASKNVNYSVLLEDQ